MSMGSFSQNVSGIGYLFVIINLACLGEKVFREFMISSFSFENIMNTSFYTYGFGRNLIIFDKTCEGTDYIVIV